MNSYHFNVGDTTRGPLGLCARINADSEERALEILRETIGEEYVIQEDPCLGEGGVEYLNIYFNGDKITTKDIDDVVNVDGEEEEA